ncbi:uncharacterized protein LOC144424630 [Styela clava]
MQPPLDKMLAMILLIMANACLGGDIDKTIDMCENNREEISHKYVRWTSTATWTLRGNDCAYPNSMLLLKLTEMDLYKTSYCYGYLQISAFRSNINICAVYAGCCFLITANSSSINGFFVQMSDCKRIYWIFRDDIFPVTITYSRYELNDHSFKIDVRYLSQRTETTTATPTQSSPIERTLSIILGILTGIVLVALLAVIIRYRSIIQKLHANSDALNATATLETARGSGEQNPYDFANEEIAGTSNNASANVPDAVYSVVNKQAKKSAKQQ